MLKNTQKADDEYYSHLRNDFLALFPKTSSRVLDIGCATGQALGHFKRAGAEKTVGIELRSDVAELARRSGNVDELHIGDFMSLELPYPEHHFDVILASFVLEHVPDPWTALARIKSLLSKSGILIASLPNVRHISVSLPLIFRGKWEYEAEGIMDRTHLRFFSRNTILQMLQDSELQPLKFIPEFAGSKNVLLNRVTLGLMPDLFAYAFNFVAGHAPTADKGVTS